MKRFLVYAHALLAGFGAVALGVALLEHTERQPRKVKMHVNLNLDLVSGDSHAYASKSFYEAPGMFIHVPRIGERVAIPGRVTEGVKVLDVITDYLNNETLVELEPLVFATSEARDAAVETLKGFNFTIDDDTEF